MPYLKCIVKQSPDLFLLKKLQIQLLILMFQRIYSKAPHSKLCSITGKGATPHRITGGVAFIPLVWPRRMGYSAENFIKDNHFITNIVSMIRTK